MAWYVDDKDLKMALFDDCRKIFDGEYPPGEIAHESGIYKCVNCKLEAAVAKGKSLPPQNSHLHDDDSGILWKLIVLAAHQI